MTLTTQQAAARIGLKRARMCQLIKANRISPPPTRFNGAWMIAEDFKVLDNPRTPGGKSHRTAAERQAWYAERVIHLQQLRERTVDRIDDQIAELKRAILHGRKG